METNPSNYDNSNVTNNFPITRTGSALENESQLKSTQGVISKSSKTFTQDNAYADSNFKKNANFENEIDINNIESAAQDIAQEDLKNGRQQVIKNQKSNRGLSGLSEEWNLLQLRRVDLED